MRRIAVMMLIAGGLAGCQGAKKDTDMQSAALDYGAIAQDLYTDQPLASTSAAGAGAYDDIPYSPPSTTYEPVAARSSTHVVMKGDTLYGLARKYYGNQSKWRDIYEANRNVLSDPNRLRVGMELAIP